MARAEINALKDKRYNKKEIELMEKKLKPHEEALAYLKSTIKTPEKFSYTKFGEILGIEVNTDKDNQTIITFVK